MLDPRVPTKDRVSIVGAGRLVSPFSSSSSRPRFFASSAAPSFGGCDSMVDQWTTRRNCEQVSVLDTVQTPIFSSLSERLPLRLESNWECHRF